MENENMNKNEARVEGASLIFGSKQILRTTQPTDDTVPLLNEIAKRWNAYKKLIDFLERAEYAFNCAILRTPTGKVREECTGLNIERMGFINESKTKAQPVREEGDEHQT